MPRVLIVAPSNMVSGLSRTVLWRHDVERLFAVRPDEGLEAIRTSQPGLVILSGGAHDATVQQVEAIRKDPQTRRVSLAVVRDEVSLDEDVALRRAGANAILAGAISPDEWDARLEELLNVPRRREARVPVHFAVWNYNAEGDPPTEGVSVNLSTRGMLLETSEELPQGSRLDLSFRLPGEHVDLRVVAQTVREEPRGGLTRYGLEFLILRDPARERIRSFVAAAEKA
jgi:DNA-binding response OmpR family regulator